MRFYLVILSDIAEKADDAKFAQYVNENQFEYWRYTALNWILATPDTVSTNNVLTEVVAAYGPAFSVVLEISINDVAGILPGFKELPDINPYTWFHTIREKGYVPKWEKKKQV